jgi:hypothetical protein
LRGGSGGGASLSLYGRSVKGTWMGSSLSGDPEGYVEEGSGDRHVSIGAPLVNMKGVSFTGTLRDG